MKHMGTFNHVKILFRFPPFIWEHSCIIWCRIKETNMYIYRHLVKIPFDWKMRKGRYEEDTWNLKHSKHTNNSISASGTKNSFRLTLTKDLFVQILNVQNIVKTYGRQSRSSVQSGPNMTKPVNSYHNQSGE